MCLTLNKNKILNYNFLKIILLPILFYIFLIFLSSLKLKTGSPRLRINTAEFITKTPLLSNPYWVEFQ